MGHDIHQNRARTHHRINNSPNLRSGGRTRSRRHGRHHFTSTTTQVTLSLFNRHKGYVRTGRQRRHGQRYLRRRNRIRYLQIVRQHRNRLTITTTIIRNIPNMRRRGPRRRRLHRRGSGIRPHNGDSTTRICGHYTSRRHRSRTSFQGIQVRVVRHRHHMSMRRQQSRRMVRRRRPANSGPSILVRTTLHMKVRQTNSEGDPDRTTMTRHNRRRHGRTSSMHRQRRPQHLNISMTVRTGQYSQSRRSRPMRRRIHRHRTAFRLLLMTRFFCFRRTFLLVDHSSGF